MVKAAIVSIVEFCTKYAYLTIAVSLLIAGGAGYYSALHFNINTDINTLISEKLGWRQREVAYNKAFPDRDAFILAVVDAPTPELSGLARTELVAELAGNKALFRSVTPLGGTPFFVKNGLLFLPKDEVAGVTRKLTEAAPLLRVPATDPSLRGLNQMIAYALSGIKGGQVTLDATAPTFGLVAQTLDSVVDGKPTSFSWADLVSGTPSSPSDLRRFIEIAPMLDYTALEPGAEATAAIRGAVAKLDLEKRYQARVRLTGPVAIENEEFGTIKEGAATNGMITLAVVLLILWLALRSFKIIVAVVIALFIGLSVTAMAGLMMVGSLNMISVAFAVLFVGLGVDFGIQFCVRYRQERFKTPDLMVALSNSGARAGIPLTLAAAAVAAGFFSFLPTAYRGVSELGEIAGVGMMIAYACSITVLPALLRVLNPSGEKEGLGFASLAPVDDFLETHRVAIVVTTLAVAIAGLPLLYFLRFDFNPMNLRSPKVESIATYLDLSRDPTAAANAIDYLVTPGPGVQQTIDRLKALPEVDRVMTLTDFVPADQTEKLAAIQEAKGVLDPVLALPVRSPPSDAENVAALKRSIEGLTQAAAKQEGPGFDAATHLAAALTKLSEGDQALRQRAEAVFVVPIKSDLDDLRNLLQAAPITLEGLPPEVTRDWRTPDGKVRVQVMPKGDPDDNENIRAFARAVLAVEPNAIGGPISILESGRTIVSAFIEAGGWALLSISLLLWITLRRFGDVLLTLVPLLLAGVVTLEICVLIGMPLNFANIIALPLLLGIGVAFKIYFVMAWRAGRTKLLQSSLTRAIIFSAATTATAFGSLWFSSHPGTSSMGKLLALSLVCTLTAAVLFQPALMGKPRTVNE